MKIFAIRDASLAKDRDLAWLLYYPAADEFHIEICDGVDEWDAPLLISSFVRRGKKSLDLDSSRLWAELRIIPPDRQNLGMILRDNGLDTYDPFRLLVLAGGRCAQDDCFLVPLRENQLPEELEKRLQKTLVSFLPATPSPGSEAGSSDVFFFFRDGMIRRISDTDLRTIEDLKSKEDLQKEQLNRLSLYRDSMSRFSITAGGHGIRISEGGFLSAEDLREKGRLLPLTQEDLRTYIRQNVIDTATAADLLHCTRQNIQDLVRRGKLQPVLTIKNNFLFLIDEIFTGPGSR